MNPNDSFALPKHGGHPLKDARKEAMFAELHSLLGSGLDFSRSFSLLIEGERDVQTKTLLSSLYRSVVRGEALARAFERSGRFAPLDCGASASRPAGSTRRWLFWPITTASASRSGV